MCLSPTSWSLLDQFSINYVSLITLVRIINQSFMLDDSCITCWNCSDPNLPSRGSLKLSGLGPLSVKLCVATYNVSPLNPLLIVTSVCITQLGGSLVINHCGVNHPSYNIDRTKTIIWGGRITINKIYRFGGNIKGEGEPSLFCYINMEILKKQGTTCFEKYLNC